MRRGESGRRQSAIYAVSREREIGELWKAIAIQQMHHSRNCSRVVEGGTCNCKLGQQLEEVLSLEKTRGGVVG